MKKIQFPPEFNVLAVYNAEVYRGIMHTDEWKLRMGKLQSKYLDWLTAHYGIDTDAIRARTQGQSLDGITT